MLEGAPPPPAPLGARGTCPVFFPTPLFGPALKPITSIPGVLRVRDGVACTWDAAASVARALGVPAPVPPAHEGVLPGLERYKALGLNTKRKPHQPVDIMFLARRAFAILAEPMRSGKTFICLASDILIGSRKTLIVCPAIAKWVWADEIAQWTGEQALLLEGRAANEARLYCTACLSRGVLSDGTPCTACIGRNGQSYGYTIIDAPQLSPIHYRDGKTGEIRWTDVGRFACTRHPEVTSKSAFQICARCKADVANAIRAARYVVVNYDLLVPQEEKKGSGGEKNQRKTHLEGWSSLLAGIDFDVAILDESHLLRGWKPRKGRSRRERTRDTVARVPRVWAVTGTPFYGFTRDIWGQLDIISGGLFDPRGFRFFDRYCGGHKDRYAYRADGRSIYAETELVDRLSHIMIKRTREELYGEGKVPPKLRSIVRIDVEGAQPFRPSSRANVGKSMADAIRQIAAKKRAVVIEALLQELAEGNKVVVLCYHVESARSMFKALEEEKEKKEIRPLMRSVSARCWLVTGEDPASPKAKKEAAGDFRAHKGAGAFCATMDAITTAISLKSASSAHFVDLHWSPGAMFQVEDRAFAEDIEKLALVYYVARGTVDDHVEAEVLPKVETLARLAKEKGADALLQTFASAKDEERTFDAVWARLTAHLASGLDATQGAEG